MPEFSIDREGVWHHRGVPIRREALLWLFAGMLRRGRDGAWVLESAGQRVPVDVVDAPFVATEARVEQEAARQRIWLRTSTGREVPVDREHPLLLRPDPVRGETRLYHRISQGLEALVHRNVFYRLAELAEPEPRGERLGIHSDGAFFPLE
jgi:hypothetical protein